MARTEPIESLTTKPDEFIQQIKASGETVILTVEGKAELIVQSVDQSQDCINMLDKDTESVLLERLSTLDDHEYVEALPVLENMLTEQKSRLST